MTGPDLSGIEPPSRVEIPTLRPSPDARDDSLVAPNIPRYRIIRQLGIGGMGAVWQAEQQLTLRVVALKVIRPGWVSTPLLRRFEHEVELLGRLQHPGIAQIFEAGTADSGSGPQPFFAMELINGLRLDEWAARTKPALPKRLDMLTRICDAVQYAHQKGVIHRDLKPGNILVDESGQPKILDFGVARAIDSDVKATSINTSTGQIIGTLQYMSPEQASGEAHQVDTRSDVYALGVIAYELVADRLPYDLQGKPLPEAIRVIREEQRTRLSEINRDFRGDLETIVGKALERERDRRYGSASEMGADIRHFLNYEPISARPPSTWYQLSKFARRNKVLVGGVAVVFLVLLGGVVTTSLQWYRARRAEQLSQRRFDDVRSLASKLIRDLEARIRNLPGSTPAIKLLAESSLEYLNKLAAEAGGDATLLAELSLAYERVGSMFNLTGDNPAALCSYGQAQDIRRRLLEAEPTNTTVRRAMAQCLGSIGETLENSGDRSAALNRHREALSVFQALSEAQPNNIEARHDVWYSLGTIGSVLARAGDLPAALESHQQALTLCEQLPASEASTSRGQFDLAISHEQIGRDYQVIGNPDRALEHLRKCAEAYERLGEANPNSQLYARRVASSNVTLGDLLAARGDKSAALSRYRVSLAVVQRLADPDPANAGLQAELSLCHGRVGNMHLAAGDNDAARRSYRDSLAIAQKLVDANKSDAFAARQVAVNHGRLADLDRAAKDMHAALSHDLSALAVMRRLAEIDPTSTRAQQDLATAYVNVGNTHASLADGARAAGAASDQLSHLTQARDAHAAAARIFRDLKDQQKLPKSEFTVPIELQKGISEFETAIAALKSAATQPATTPASVE